MFGLKVPISSIDREQEFDSVSTILSQSSITRQSNSKGQPEWLNCAGHDGGLFHLELSSGVQAKLVRLSSLDGGSVSSLALGTGCNSEDTGYSSDQDLAQLDQPTKSDRKLGRPRVFKQDRFSRKTRTSSSSSSSSDKQLVSATFKSRSLNGSVLDESLDDGVFLQKNLRSSQTSTVSSSSTGSQSSCEHSKLGLPSNQTVKPFRSRGLSKSSETSSEWSTVELEVRTQGQTTCSTRPGQNGIVLCEQLLGISLLAHDDFTSKLNPYHVVIKGLLPHCDSTMTPDAAIGSRLHSINRQELTWYNMNSIMSSISKLKKVKLTLKSPRPDKSSLDLEKLVRVLSSNGHDHPGMDSMAAMYLSLDHSSNDQQDGSIQDGLVYSFPPEKNSIHQLQGMFYTLAHLVKDINKFSSIRNTTITLQDQRIHVAYQQEYSDILVFAMPASHISVQQLNTLLSEFTRLLRVHFGSLESAFIMGNHSSLIDSILTYLFRQVLQMSPLSSSSPSPAELKDKVNINSECLPFARFSRHISSISLPEELQTEVDKPLSKFSSADFADMSENFYGCRRKYHILGSCFYYAGQLIGSQLSPPDLRDIHLYLQHCGLLELTARCSIAQLVTWQEIFPTRFCHDIADINNSFGYSEPNARWCQLIVGLKYGLFCCLLETVNSLNIPAKKSCPLSPDLFYIDQAKACLLQLQTPRLLSFLKMRISKDCQSAMTKSDYCATYIKTSYEKTTQLFGESLKQRTGTNNSFVVALQSDWRKISSRNHSGGPQDYLYQSHESGKLYPATNSQIGIAGSFELSIPVSISNLHSTSRVSAGRHPSIYQYCYLDGLEGTLVIGSDVESPGIFQSLMVMTFYLCCRQIHDFFQDMGEKSQGQIYSSADETESYDVVSHDVNLRGMKEHGVLMSFNPHNKEDGHKNHQALEYWVVGRRLKRPKSREMFVCFHTSASQSIIDLAFKVF